MNSTWFSEYDKGSMIRCLLTPQQPGTHSTNPSCASTTLYMDALEHNYDPENPRLWKTIRPSCNVSHNMSVRLRCFLLIVTQSFTVSYMSFKLWNQCNWLTPVVAPPPIKHLLFIVQQ